MKHVNIVPVALSLLAIPFGVHADAAKSTAKEPGTVELPAMRLPPSKFLSDTARRLEAEGDTWGDVRRCAREKFGDPSAGRNRDAETLVRWERVFGPCADQIYFEPLARKQLQAFPVETRQHTVAGVKVEEFTPRDGIAPNNRNRVLINLHGGGFKSGSVLGGRVESPPIAALGRIRIVSVDYRQGPEHRFPAASDDVVAVYRELLKDHRPQDIGIFGCSAGGTLTGQVVRKIIVDRLPVPGAAGMFCAGAFLPSGDSAHLASAIFDARSPGRPDDPPATHTYFDGANIADPAVTPGNDPTTLRCFPPTLLISATRDTAMSAVVHTHTEMLKVGVPAELAVWEGLGHGFFYDPQIPESREVYAAVVSFFDRSLGKQRAAPCP